MPELAADHLGLELLTRDPRRLVVLDTVHNFRDLGGYPVLDGARLVGTTRWALLYRADGLYRLSPADLEVVRRLGLRTVVDLRSQPELDERGRFPTDAVDVEFHHLPIIDATWDHSSVAADVDATEFLVWAYTDMIARGSERFAAAFSTLAQPGALPGVFHCAAGKDRTGLLAAFVLSAIGVPREVVLRDYELTGEGIARMRAWVQREFPEMAERMADTPSAFLAAVPAALDQVLERLCAEHGSVTGFLAGIGVGPATVAAMAAQLVEPI
jgi:protein-tyrosine phosphatase